MSDLAPEALAADGSEVFDEAAYLRTYPDVAEAIARGDVRSGYAHYLLYGLREGRKPGVPPSEPRQTVVRIAAAAQPAAEIAHNLEALIVSPGGGILLLGWIDDSEDPLDAIRLFGPGWRVALDGPSLGRARRMDVEEALGRRGAHAFGYYGFLFAGGPVATHGRCQVEIVLRSGRACAVEMAIATQDDSALRDAVLGHVRGAHHFGNPIVSAVAGLDGGSGREIVRFNRHITESLISSPYVERFGERAAEPKASLIVCLYGKPEFLFVQSALFGAAAGFQDYELVFVSNSPELAETLLREARASALIYGVQITVVILMGNAGFGAANNVAARHARTRRIVFVNPDVFPCHADWALAHARIVDEAPERQTRLFGTRLFYDDGSLMHAGMYFELDGALSLAPPRPRLCRLVRVEHYGKGAPPGAEQFMAARPVPAVTGAFMSFRRDWFERLQGFSHDYVFGHYEDADLCLRSLDAGAPAHVHDLPMWHLEGKGSTRRPAHEGGVVVNRWLFTSTWGELIVDGLLGPEPTRKLAVGG